MAKILAFLKRITPLRISMAVALAFCMVHFTIESEVFEFGPFSKKGFIHFLDLKSLDLKFLTRGEDYSSEYEPQVIIAAIDEKGVDRYGLWPWSRQVIADFIRVTTEGGAKVIGFDATFADEDKNASYKDIKRFLDAYEENGLKPKTGNAAKLANDLGGVTSTMEELQAVIVQLETKARKMEEGEERRKLMNNIRGLKKAVEKSEKSVTQARATYDALTKQSGEFYQDMEHVVMSGSPDEAFSKSLATSPQTVMGFISFYNEADVVGVAEDEAKKAFGRMETVAVRNIYERVYQDAGDTVVELMRPVEGVDITEMQIRRAVGALVPLERFSENIKGFGYFNVNPDPDGPMRRIRMLNRYEDTFYPSLSLAVATKYYDGEVRPLDGTIKPGVTIDGINIASDVDVPTDLHGRFIVNYYQAPEKYFPTYSVADFIDGTVPPDVYKDKVVLFGMTALGLYDLRPTPFSATTPGVYIHASAIQNVLDGNYLERYYGLALLEILGYLLLGVVMGLVLPRVPAWGGLLITIGFAIGLYLIDVSFVFANGIWLLNVLPTLQATVAFIGVSVYGYLTEGREKRKVRKAFQFYLTKSVVDEMLKSPEKLQLGGEKRVCTVLFSDIRGFTTISERLTPEQLVNLLNEYLTPMTNLVFKYDGTLDKYMGDAIMAIFGAPVAYPNHATRAAWTSLEMMEELAVLQEGWRKDGVPELDIGIGLNTGPMSVGNMGSEVRFDYTVMGDNVNLGSRLEGINKQYGTNIICSEVTKDACGDDVHTRLLDSVRVKGKLEPVQIYEILGKGKASGKMAKFITTFEQAIATYKAQEWDKAIEMFQHVRADLKSNDFCSNMYIERCEQMRANPPGEDWDGVYTMTTK